MITNTQNNKQNSLNVNTRGIQMYNKDGFEPSALVLGFWNDFLSIRIHPTLPEDKITESRVYNYEVNISAVLRVESVRSLVSGIRTYILPAIEAGEDKSISVTLPGNSVVTVGTGKKITGSIRPFVAIYKDINPDTRKPESWLHYEFTSTDTIMDYDKDTGDCEVVKDYISQLYLFIEFLNCSVVSMMNAMAHSISYNTRYEKEKLMNTINAMAEKSGVSTNYKKNNANRVSWGTSNSSITPQPDSLDHADTLESLDDLEV